MKKLLLILAALILAVVVALPVATPAKASPLAVKMFAGNDGEWIGSVTVWNDADNLYVEILVWGGWYLSETHVAVGGSLGDIPQNKKGNPKIGHFDYSSEHGPGERKVKHTIPLAGLPGTVVIAAHAWVYIPDGDPECYREETAWAYNSCIGLEFPGNSWATAFYYTIQ